MLESFHYLLAAFGGALTGAAFGIFAMYQYCVRNIIKCHKEIKEKL